MKPVGKFDFFYFSGSNNAYFETLEKMSSNDLFTFIDDILSDIDSEVGDVSDEENEEGGQMSEANSLFDIENLPIDFEDIIEPTNEETEPTNEETGWDSEDDLPLIVIQQQELAKTTIWTKNPDNCLKIFKIFAQDTGPNIDDQLETPTEVFLAVFPSNLIQKIVFETNLYALQKKGNASSYTQTNEDEMKKFFAINMLMGIKKIPSLRDFWSSNYILRDNFITTVLSRDRFVWLLGNLHLNDNSIMPERNSPNYDKLYKLRPLINILSATFMSTYRPSKNQSIDESKIRFKGRSSLKQFMPLKPIK